MASTYLPLRRSSHSHSPPPSPSSSSSSYLPPRARPRPFLSPRALALPPLLKLALPLLLLLALLTPLAFFEPHLELSFYSRAWIAGEVQAVRPLAGCFDPHRVHGGDGGYNVSERVWGRKGVAVSPGVPMRMGMDCYDFAGTIPSKPLPPLPVAGGNTTAGTGTGAEGEKTEYHTYWRTDLAPFGPRQEWMLKSFFATQDLTRARLTLWSNGDLSANPLLRRWLARFPGAFRLGVVDYAELARGTALEGTGIDSGGVMGVKDGRAWVDGDLVRLLVMWRFGGVWVDMDSLLVRDLGVLMEHEFVTQWDCYDKTYVPFNGALMHFHKHSPYLCEAFHIISTSPPPRPGTTDWGATLYLKLWRRLVASHIPPFSVLPFCFTDARSCRLDNRLPDPFAPDPVGGGWVGGMGREMGGGLDRALGRVFSVHLHNQWERGFPEGGWVERLLLRRYEERLGAGA